MDWYANRTRKGMMVMRYVLIALAALEAAVFLGWLGLEIKPAPFAPYNQPSGSITRVPLPPALPAPVERFYRRPYGDQVPVITSAVISGRATMRPDGPVDLPIRYRPPERAGQASAPVNTAA